MSGRQTFSTISEYLAALEPHPRKQVKAVMGVVRKQVPDAVPGISYGIPAFKSGRVFLYCAAFRNHVGLYPPVRGDTALMKALKPYSNAKGNLRFSLDDPLPISLIARVVKALARQYAQPQVARQKRKPTKSRAARLPA